MAKRAIPTAGDGLPARLGGPWTQDKLTYLKKYASGFMVAMAKKNWERLVYIDLLAGPGLDMNEETRQEFAGSPLIALQTRPAFDKLYLGDADRHNVAALRERIPPQELKTRVELEVGDCHTRAQALVGSLPRGALGLAFVDPEGFEVTFDLFRQLARAQLDGWRDLSIAKRAARELLLTAEEERRLQHSLIGAFRDRMTSLGYAHQDRDDPAMLNSKRAIMYHLLFFSKHSAGLKIWRGIKKIGPDQQRTLDLYPEGR
jgi:hypothetical protein